MAVTWNYVYVGIKKGQKRKTVIFSRLKPKHLKVYRGNGDFDHLTIGQITELGYCFRSKVLTY